MPLSLAGIDLEPIREDSGAYVKGRAITAALRVSANGDGTTGESWTKAYTTMQAALDAASTDGDDLTLIMDSPHTTNYDIDTPGNPTWAANVILAGSYRNWAKIKNTHASAASIMKLTGKSAAINLNFNLGTGGGNGLIMTHGGFRVLRCMFIGEDLTNPATALHVDGNTAQHGEIIGCNFKGEPSNMRGLLLDNASCTLVQDCRLGFCTTAIQIINTASDYNKFFEIDVCSSAIGIDLDAGNNQQFDHIHFMGNTTNVDDEVGDSTWLNIFGSFPIAIEPNNLVGVQVNAGAANTYGGDTQIRAAVTSTVPFRIVGVHLEPSAGEWYQLRFSADAGTTFYDILQFDATKREGIAAPSGTEFIFNVGTRISASVKSESGGNNTKVWLEIQEI